MFGTTYRSGNNPAGPLGSAALVDVKMLRWHDLDPEWHYRTKIHSKHLSSQNMKHVIQSPNNVCKRCSERKSCTTAHRIRAYKAIGSNYHGFLNANAALDSTQFGKTLCVASSFADNPGAIVGSCSFQETFER